ncbi:MerR family transcriptional regulator [Streptomyces avermitilis]|uniref:MerR-family transcriptional regulator n=2 Tax=Streptomyces avermitilis TaxID=33903 RepID=Q82M74_STRAW|nr:MULTISPECIES: MerR family transcriptional regulator [Streptomyces]KUN55926.1 MerR family transcriptional regulator [Streptomyces avermitilis]MYS97412.1 MerR family transcriptional regulator [Streptomyces sp. SID5469]OOV25312.1 MerR family transcriptional regulator [Streptomyces avermitilis]BAC69497.1 putative MerR-family transcriptional regulator [Streptomyces avermitilis MA-4680 = NBRC 14893]GDY78377.1 MerR family transcriptional regulator [Streptomyces avermitilis]
MRIGEIAALVGVTTRAIRHYHHVGLLPEPERRPNGYRAYSVRDAVLLARVRRLTELGLSLDEVRDVLADDAGRDLADVLEELDADLARQEAEIGERRRRLAVLLAAEPRDTEPLSPALAALLAKTPHPASPAAAKDREHLTLLDAAGSGGQELYAALGPLAADPALLALYERLDALAEAPTDDPRIPALAAELVAAVPDEVFAAISAEGQVVAGFQEALLAEYAPAQAEVVRRVMEAFMRRSRG